MTLYGPRPGVGPQPIGPHKGTICKCGNIPATDAEGRIVAHQAGVPLWVINRNREAEGMQPFPADIDLNTFQYLVNREPEPRIDAMARRVVAQIRDMQQAGELPAKVADFGALHDYFDANAGWGSDIDDLPHVDWTAVQHRVNELLEPVK